MKTLADYKGEEALALLADIMEPLAVVLADDEIQAIAKVGGAPIKYIKPMLKNHPTEIVEVLARIADQPVEEYRDSINVFTLPAQLLAFINDPIAKDLFTSQAQRMDQPSSGSAMEDNKE